MRRSRQHWLVSAIVGTCLTFVAAPAWATEFGNSHADLGYIDTLAGLPLAPGFYLRDDVNVTTSGRFNNQNGDPVNLNLGPLGTYGAKVRSTAVADIVSGVYTPDYRIPYLNATIGVAFYQFIASSRAELTSALGQPESSASTKGGFGDITVVPLYLGFDVPNSDFHFVFSAVRVHGAEWAVFEERSDREQSGVELLELSPGAGDDLSEQDGSGIQHQHEHVHQQPEQCDQV